MNSQRPADEVILTFADVKALFRRSRKKIIVGALLGALLVGLFILMQPIQYTSNGSFLEKGKSEVQLAADAVAASLFKGESKERPAIAAIKSRKILESVIAKLDLQATVRKDSGLPSIVDSLLEHAGEIPKNLKAEYAHLTLMQTPALEDPRPEISVKHVHYDGIEPIVLKIRFLSGERYQVSDQAGKLLGEGRLGEPFQNSAFAFTLEQDSMQPIAENAYKLTLLPISDLAMKLAKKLKISSDFNSKSFLELKFRYPTQSGAHRILDAVMDSYRAFLLEEHHRLVSAQVDYLKQRQDDIDLQTVKLIQEQARQISAPSNNLEQLVAAQQTLNRKYLSNELKLKQLQNCADGGACIYTGDDDGKRLAIIQNMQSELQRDRQQCDTLVLALENTSSPALGEPIAEGVQSHVLLLGNSKVHDKQFEGIDLETARQLYPTYAQELHHIEAQITQIQRAANEIHQPHFELGALAVVLKDSVSQDLLNAANATSAALKDTHNRTTRELERLQRDLDVQKDVLGSHLEQTIQLMTAKHGQLKQNTRAFLQAMLEQLQQKIVLGEKHFTDYLTASIAGLNQEQRMIQTQQRDLQLDLDKLPKQWVDEKLINLHLEANGMVLQQIGSLIETKNISDNLDATLSAPFDRALKPLQPDAPYLLVFMLFGGAMGGMIAFGTEIFRSAAAGPQATKENLTAAGWHVAGELTLESGIAPAQDIATLRRLSASICPQSQAPAALLLLLGDGRDYAGELAELLSKRGQKVLLIPLAFEHSASPEMLPGLLQYLEGNASAPKIVSRGAYDSLNSGGISPFGIELLESKAFKQLLEKLLERYDWVVATSKVPPTGAEAESLLRNFDRAAITLSDETLPQLEGVFTIAHANSAKKMTFILSI